MAIYNLDHLTQSEDQYVLGPIQDDEALFLYSIVRGMRLKRILEFGGLNGYSAQNFLAATGQHGVVYTVDYNEVPRIASNHITIKKDARLLTPDDLDNKPLDMIFFDCHDYNVQMELFVKLKRHDLLTDTTVLALHDTNVHPIKVVDWSYPIEDGFVHQAVERRMVNDFRRMGYDAFCLHTELSVHDESFPCRHGVTVLRKQKNLPV